ncbi:hypothetical protein BT69DRAFT_1336745 [Atractiella rhizophila]|nr:hypothetical protein BT69DRAFT_1336745 [Atractiella rhizophila]
MSTYAPPAPRRAGKKLPARAPTPILVDSSDLPSSEDDESDGSDEEETEVKEKEWAVEKILAYTDFEIPKRQIDEWDERAKLPMSREEREGWEQDKQLTQGWTRFYYVKWSGYSTSENTWEVEENVHDCDLYMDFLGEIEAGNALRFMPFIDPKFDFTIDMENTEHRLLTWPLSYWIQNREIGLLEINSNEFMVRHWWRWVRRGYVDLSPDTMAILEPSKSQDEQTAKLVKKRRWAPVQRAKGQPACTRCRRMKVRCIGADTPGKACERCAKKPEIEHECSHYTDDAFVEDLVHSLQQGEQTLSQNRLECESQVDIPVAPDLSFPLPSPSPSATENIHRDMASLDMDVPELNFDSSSTLPWPRPASLEPSMATDMWGNEWDVGLSVAGFGLDNTMDQYRIGDADPRFGIDIPSGRSRGELNLQPSNSSLLADNFLDPRLFSNTDAPTDKITQPKDERTDGLPGRLHSLSLQPSISSPLHQQDRVDSEPADEFYTPAPVSEDQNPDSEEEFVTPRASPILEDSGVLHPSTPSHASPTSTRSTSQTPGISPIMYRRALTPTVINNHAPTKDIRLFMTWNAAASDLNAFRELQKIVESDDSIQFLLHPVTAAIARLCFNPTFSNVAPEPRIKELHKELNYWWLTEEATRVPVEALSAAEWSIFYNGGQSPSRNSGATILRFLPENCDLPVGLRLPHCTDYNEAYDHAVRLEMTHIIGDLKSIQDVLGREASNYKFVVVVARRKMAVDLKRKFKLEAYTLSNVLQDLRETNRRLPK